MEKTGTIHVDLGDTTKLTWIEYKLEQFVELIKERLPKIVQPKDVVSDFDKSIWFTSIVVLLGKVLPANRFLFRIVEEENQFLIQLHDPAQIQQPQEIEVPYRKGFDWKIGSWEEAKAIKTSKDRIALLNYWKSSGMSVKDISKHFGHKSASTIYCWQQHRCTELGYKERCTKSSRSTQIRKIVTVLKDAGLKHVSSCLMAKLLNCNAKLVNNAKQYMKRQATVLTIDETDIDCAIAYIKLLLLEFESYAKRVESQDGVANDWTARTIYEITGIGLDNRVGYNCQTGKHLIRLNCHQYNKVTKYLNDVLNNLNQMKGEGK